MRRAIDQILEGNFGYENGSLDFSCSKLELTLSKGSVYEGTFTILSAPGRMTRGYVTTSDLRMECLTPTFTGVSEEIAFCFHGEHLEESEEVKGEFYIISNQGEYYLPFAVTLSPTVLTSSIGNIKNLFHFANLAKSNWAEAVNLFYSPEFYRVFTGNDRQFYDSYRGLSVYRGNEQNVEEFLMEVNKKQKIEYIVEESVLMLDNPLGVAESILTILRNGWGFTCLLIEVEGDFVFTEKEVITDDDFLGNYCRLPVYVDGHLLRYGKNYGQITLHNSYTTLTIPVIVRMGESHGLAGNAHREGKRVIVQLMEFYQAFRMKKIGTSTWLKETGKLVERMRSLDEKNVVARLFQSQLLITEERYNEAQWLLEHAMELLERKQLHGRKENPVMEPGVSPEEKRILRAYYFYLTTLINREEAYVNRVAEEVGNIYRQDRTCWRVAWLLLYLSEDYNRNVTRKWNFIEKQIDYGCTSPVMNIEALLLLNNNPTFLRKLGEFELQVLSYGAKEEMLSPEVTQQLLYLAGRVKEYSGALFRILENCYRREPDTRILQEICALLIKGGKTDRKYFMWYKRGVENELRITKLYEYYIASIDIDIKHSMETEQVIPKIVLMYFSYQNNLDYEHSAFLYAYLLRQVKEKLSREEKHSMEGYEDLLGNYRGRIERFVIEQIQKEHINPHLAYLYQELLTPGMIGEQTAPALSRLIFAHWICLKQPGIRNVIVYYGGSLAERIYPLTGNSTWLPLYGKDYTILFEDADGNRFKKNVEYTLESLLLPSKYIKYVATYVNVHLDEHTHFDGFAHQEGHALQEGNDYLELNLYLCENSSEAGDWSADAASRALWLTASPNVSVQVKRDYCLKLLTFFYDHDDVRSLDSYLERISPEELSGREQGEALRYMVLRGQFDLAYHWLISCGPYGADLKTLVRLCSERMRQTDFVEDSVLTGAAVYAFGRGKYDGNILRYLADYYRGMTKDMRDIWKAACSFEVECYRLSEKILVQMLFSGSYVGEKMEIFRGYVSQGAKPKVKEAFLAQCAYDFFVKEKISESYVFDEIYYMQQRNEPVHKICKLAYLKYYAEHPEEIDAERKPVLEEYLKEMMKEGICLNFFREIRDCEDILQSMADKTIIEYRAHPESRVRIHYVILHENGGSESYLAEDMNPVYGGVCFKEFILFFGESLQFYIVEIRDQEEQLTESGNIQKSDTAGKGVGSKFEMINDIVISKILQDYDTLDYLLEEYYRKEFLNEKLFCVR